ncbi:MAG: alpha-1,4-glucan--maltose-1-phosphate maltosyltransferase [Nitrospiraceae bacterium]
MKPQREKTERLKAAPSEQKIQHEAITEDGRRRVVIEQVQPEIDGGRFPVKRVVGESVVVEADLFADGHDVAGGAVRYRHDDDPEWQEVVLAHVDNDRWQATFPVVKMGRYRYQLMGWIDHFATWQRDMRKRMAAGQDVTMDILIGRDLIKQAGVRAQGIDAERITALASALVSYQPTSNSQLDLVLDKDVTELMSRCADRRWATTYDHDLSVIVDREKARFSTWYEMFPRSCAAEPGRHGTFKDCESLLPDIAMMGFDVVYFPPIHPIGYTFRKGKNNDPAGGPEAVGSPWAIGASDGGHRAIHAELGTMDDFTQLMNAAKTCGLEIALDLAFQCSPDHPYVKQHPEWFTTRPDGTIQYAENPPKKYQDIYPLNFESAWYPALWKELKDVVVHWIVQGVRIFRVDNPHTKPFPFWHWLITEVKREHPDVLFLAEAFTRPKVMGYLAKLGFTQSYTYFAWRTTKAELTAYCIQLTKTDMREYFRPNFWPNTPDILTEQLQHGGRPMFMSRLILAATLSANYGMYGPAFELMEHRPQQPGSEEYLDSEKYELRTWDRTNQNGLREFIGLVNRTRRQNPALQNDWSLQFHAVDNEQLLAYSKQSPDGNNVVLVVVNLSPHHTHSGWVNLDLQALGLSADRPFQVQDLLTNAYYIWQGSRNYVEINPHTVPAHIFAVHRSTRKEQDFDYFM